MLNTKEVKIDLNLLLAKRHKSHIYNHRMQRNYGFYRMIYAAVSLITSLRFQSPKGYKMYQFTKLACNGVINIVIILLDFSNMFIRGWSEKFPT